MSEERKFMGRFGVTWCFATVLDRATGAVQLTHVVIHPHFLTFGILLYLKKIISAFCHCGIASSMRGQYGDSRLSPYL